MKEEKIEKAASKEEVANKKAKEIQSRIRDSLRRGTFDTRQGINVDTSNFDKDFVYRVVNDTPGSIEKKVNLGYEFVVGDELGAFNNSTDPQGLGSNKQIEVGRYKGSVKAYLMRCPKDIYQARKDLDRKADSTRFDSAKKENQRPDQQKE